MKRNIYLHENNFFFFMIIIHDWYFVACFFITFVVSKHENSNFVYI